MKEREVRYIHIGKLASVHLLEDIKQEPLFAEESQTLANELHHGNVFYDKKYGQFFVVTNVDNGECGVPTIRKNYLKPTQETLMILLVEEN